MITKLTSGLQITIPAEARKLLGIKPNSFLEIEIDKKEGKMILTTLKEDLDTLFEQAKKIKPKHKFTTKQMDELVENEILR